MLIALDQENPKPIYLQIVAEIKRGIEAGQVREGEELPGVRELARDLAVNLHTVHQAYRELGRLGVVTLRLGRRARVRACGGGRRRGPRSKRPWCRASANS